MRTLMLAIAIAATLLGLSAAIGGDATFAEETYRKTPFYEDGTSVTFIAFSPDGTRIAFAGENRIVRIRKADSGGEIASLTDRAADAEQRELPRTQRALERRRGVLDLDLVEALGGQQRVGVGHGVQAYTLRRVSGTSPLKASTIAAYTFGVPVSRLPP